MPSRNKTLTIPLSYNPGVKFAVQGASPDPVKSALICN
jgi:hypothetical protein